MSLLAVLGASLLGSLHCAAMCGGFASAVGAAGSTNGLARWSARLAYHLGRLLGYAVLAIVAGTLGSGLQNLGELAGVRHLAGIVMGVVLLGMAGRILLRGIAPRPEALVTLAAAPRARGSAHRMAGLLRRGGLVGAGGIGLGSALLPCGWLWMYVALAAGSGTVAGSLAVITTFWLGTLPALLGVGIVATWLRRHLGRHAPRLSAVVMVGLGLLALTGRLSVDPTAGGSALDPSASRERPPCH